MNEEFDVVSDNTRAMTKPRRGNPYFFLKCDECGQQILSYRRLGIASYFHADDEDPWRTGMSKLPIRHICVRCSNNLGYDDGN